MMAEKVVKFYEDYLRSRVSAHTRYNARYAYTLQDNLMDKLRLKNSTMRVKKQKLILQLKQVRAFVGVVRAVTGVVYSRKKSRGKSDTKSTLISSK